MQATRRVVKGEETQGLTYNNSQPEFGLPDNSSIFREKPYFSQMVRSCGVVIFIFPQREFERAVFIFCISNQNIFHNWKTTSHGYFHGKDIVLLTEEASLATRPGEQIQPLTILKMANAQFDAWRLTKRLTTYVTL